MSADWFPVFSNALLLCDVGEVHGSLEMPCSLQAHTSLDKAVACKGLRKRLLFSLLPWIHGLELLS